jgi:hypothetical protein
VASIVAKNMLFYHTKKNRPGHATRGRDYIQKMCWHLREVHGKLKRAARQSGATWREMKNFIYPFLLFLHSYHITKIRKRKSAPYGALCYNELITL